MYFCKERFDELNLRFENVTLNLTNYTQFILLSPQVEVATVKRDVTELHGEVEEQTCKVSQDLEHWVRYKDGISTVKPWLEQAEVKMAVGLARPFSISESR